MELNSGAYLDPKLSAKFPLSFSSRVGTSERGAGNNQIVEELFVTCDLSLIDVVEDLGV